MSDLPTLNGVVVVQCGANATTTSTRGKDSRKTPGKEVSLRRHIRDVDVLVPKLRLGTGMIETPFRFA